MSSETVLMHFWLEIIVSYFAGMVINTSVLSSIYGTKKKLFNCLYTLKNLQL